MSVELLPAHRLTAAWYNAAEGCFDGVETAEPFVAYVFREDGAIYSETSSGAGEPTVKHTLTMEFADTPETRRTVGELSARSPGGVVAIVTTGAGERLLTGYSPRFGGAYPLQLSKTAAASGSRPSDLPTVRVILESEDAEYSKPLKG